MRNAVEQNGVTIARTPTGIGAAFSAPLDMPNRPFKIEVDYLGRRLAENLVSPFGPPYRDYFGSGIDHLALTVRVKDGERVLAELGLPEKDYEPFYTFMVGQGEQRHVTESYVSVPPALTITDEVGAVWTLGFVRAQPEQSPHGEFAFNVLRDGVDTNEIASRIERRNGKVRVFTRHGWKVWNQQFFF